MLWPRTSSLRSDSTVLPSTKLPPTELLRAMELARASTQRREIPVDDGTWERLFRAHHVTVEFLRERLSNWNSNRLSTIRDGIWVQDSSGFLEPLLGFEVPKQNGKTRLKTLPCPEDLALQQYLLNELLRDHDEVAPSFSSLIPAVRYEYGRRTYTTGPSLNVPRNKHGEPLVLSFAYQVAMDIVNGDDKTIRDGLFRPYMDCWMDFTSYVEDAIREHFSFESKVSDVPIYVARLDIKGFYDNLARSTVQSALLPSLTQAFEANPAAAVSVARELNPATASNAEGRARQIIDILCDLSFGYPYYCPASGRAVESKATNIGVSQGPDLSAYLANVALFQFDHTINEFVNHESEACCYARYVDDMILVAKSRIALNSLTNRVSFELQKLNLELSPKSQSLEPMSYKEVRSWLRDERGTQAVSGIFETQSSSPNSNIPIFDDHGVDRRSALVRLREVSQKSSRSSTETLHDIRAALSCKNLRYNDVVRSVAEVWFVVANELAKQTNSRPLDLFADMLSSVAPAGDCVL